MSTATKRAATARVATGEIYRITGVARAGYDDLYEVRGTSVADGELGIWHWTRDQARQHGWDRLA